MVRRLCDLETSRIGAPYIYAISNLMVNSSWCTPNIYDDHYRYHDDDDDDDNNNNNNNNTILLYIYNCKSYLNFDSSGIQTQDHTRQTQHSKPRTKLYFIVWLYIFFM